MSKTSKTTKRLPKSVDVDALALPGADATREECTRFLRDCERVSLNFDRRLGRVRWLQGAMLNRLRPEYKGADWQAFLKSVNCKPTTAKYVMKIARDIPEPESFRKTYYDMLKICYPSFAKIDETEAATESKPADPSNATAPEAPVGNDQQAPASESRPSDETPAPSPVTADKIRRGIESFKGSLQDWLDAELDCPPDDIRDLIGQSDIIQALALKLRAKLQGMIGTERQAA